MFEFRVTKYDPALRDSHGAYLRDEWTAVSDIGRSFDGVVLTETQYQRVEDAYSTTAVAFLREARLPTLLVSGLENHAGISIPFPEGSVLGHLEIGTVVRRVLREEFWCRLEGAEAFIHIGWDYYMYVGTNRLCPTAEALAHDVGLFVERFQSPYRERGQAEQFAQADRRPPS